MLPRLLLIPALAAALVAPEYGSYKNPHPRPLHKCDNSDIAMLAACSNQVLAQLDDCKANDLACECCALQSMDPKCHNLCPGNPNANFLTVLVNDCAPLNDINACNLPFKKNDGAGRPKTVVEDEPGNTVSVKSQLSKPAKQLYQGDTLYSAYQDDTESSSEEEEEEYEPPANFSRPTIHIIQNQSNVTGMFLHYQVPHVSRRWFSPF
ncbi:uncharacterized protein CXQ87_002157 [Candidozyma duobushaemuli]|uniref:Extracellular membrane protein CFEM domain-containing protein n=1 Tax=Candidozyma duobushaemuli TaxID=1231522 RepID=A0A2V1A9A5_9ASCO|nr:uncharacterized protein CXQ87_002157 [[Candida] duobushaemulonis]PVH14034.1 hypothetical protein CXQ87_002157 [[Candida] duobushaemulonis]